MEDSNIATINNNWKLCPLPKKWVLYIYDKRLFQKMANRPEIRGKPYREIYTIENVNDLIYILQLMKVTNNSKIKSTDEDDDEKINLDAHNYIIMRQGIEPIWEDPKNANGGTFSIKMSHHNGYNVWSLFVMYMLTESLVSDMKYINGITVSCISNSYNVSTGTTQNEVKYTYLKIWDGMVGRDETQFIKILPPAIYNQIKFESLMYTFHNTKKHYGQEDIINKLNNNRRSNMENKNKRGFRSNRSSNNFR